MKNTTTKFLGTAGRNHALAYELLDYELSNVQPPPLEWGVVVAFYAAVHYVNAFLYECLGFTPDNHTERNRYVYSVDELKQVHRYYMSLCDKAYHARYTPGWRLKKIALQEALDTDLSEVAWAIRSALGID